MTIRRLFLGIFVLGVVIPYAAFVPWLFHNGVAPTLFVAQMFQTRIAAFFSLDVLISALVLFIAAFHAHRQGQKGLLPVLAATCLVGVSAGLPLYLYFRAAQR